MFKSPCIVSLLLVMALNQNAQAATADAPPSDTSATVDDQLRRGRNAYAYGNYAEAAKLLSGLLYPLRVYSKEQLFEARLYLGLSFYLLGERENAEEEFTKLLYIDPDYNLDPFTFAPGMLDLLEEVRQAHSPQLDAIRERTLQKNREAQKRGDNRQQPSVVTIIRTERSDVMTFMPFGAGQFQNGDNGLGATIAALQVALLAANVSAYLFLRNLRVAGRSGYGPDRVSAVRNMTILQVGSAALFGVAWSMGIFHARLNFVPILERRSVRPAGAQTRGLREAPQLRAWTQLQLQF